MKMFLSPNIDVEVWTRKIEWTLENILHSLFQPAITRKRILEIRDNKYDPLKDETARIECVGNNISVV